ncbi:MAG TPA: hypothetical protein VM571_08825 [Noviherbaspirillum sp.]|nr:hypothetical protein [Noviherbaspirillum sp.]
MDLTLSNKSTKLTPLFPDANYIRFHAEIYSAPKNNLASCHTSDRREGKRDILNAKVVKLPTRNFPLTTYFLGVLAAEVRPSLS